MKIVLLAPELFAAEGGIARVLRLYLKALCELAGPDGSVALVVLNDSDLPPERLAACAGPSLRAVQACARSRLRFVRAALWLTRGADLVVCGHVGQLPVARLCRFLSPRLDYTLVAHGIEVWRRFTLLDRAALRRVRTVWCVSAYTRSELLRRLPLPAGRTAVLPNGLDPAFSTALSSGADAAEPRPPVILTVSRLCRADRYKGIDRLIEALPEVLQRIPAATLRVVGDGDDRTRLQDLAARTGVSDAVRFLGFVPDAELNGEFDACRVFALPSTGEGFGLVFLEAMAHGKPCVGADAGGVPEVISPDAGLLCPADSVSGLAATCVEALERAWDPAAIRARADAFSYAAFRDRLKALLPG